MCSKVISSEAKASSSIAANISFNETLGVDLFLRSNHPMVPRSLSVTWCARGTLYQLCILVPDTTVAKCITERRIQYFGPPLVIIADKEKEFVGAQFKELTNASSILLHIIDARAPLQVAERNDTVTFTRRYLSALVGCTPRAAQLHFNAWRWSVTPLSIDCPIVQATLPCSECSDLDIVFLRT